MDYYTERIDKHEEQILDMKIAMLDAEMRIKKVEELLLKQIEINEGYYEILKSLSASEGYAINDLQNKKI